MKRSKLAVFDMDGTLFDTSEVNFRAYSEAAAQLGFEIDRAEFMKVFIGKNFKEFLPLFGVKEKDDLQRIHEKKKTLYAEYLQYARINNALFEVIKCIRSEYVLILATTASRKNTEEILACFGVSNLFDHIIAQEDVGKLKPDPECYLMAMKAAGIEPENTIVFEDSDIGIEAGQASGASVYRVCGF